MKSIFIHQPPLIIFCSVNKKTRLNFDETPYKGIVLIELVTWIYFFVDNFANHDNLNGSNFVCSLSKVVNNNFSVFIKTSEIQEIDFSLTINFTMNLSRTPTVINIKLKFGQTISNSNVSFKLLLVELQKRVVMIKSIAWFRRTHHDFKILVDKLISNNASGDRHI